MHAFLTIVLIHLLAVASPGPDFAIIVKQSVTQPRRIVLWTALGIGLGILVHVAYSLVGIGFIIAQSIVLFTTIKLIGAGYLLYVGLKSLAAKPASANVGNTKRTDAAMPLQALRTGFLCNALNPKVTLFFLALFTQVIDTSTPLLIQLGYGVYMAAATFVWFSLLGSVFTMEWIRRSISAVHLWAERLMGAVLIALGLKVAFAARE